MPRIQKFFLAAAVMLISGAANAIPINVAQGAAVTLNGTYGVLRPVTPWAMNPVALESTLTDDAVLPAATDWNDGTVWWDEDVAASANNSIEIDLGGTFDLIGFNVQADDNDSYLLEYWGGLAWVSAWNIPIVGGFGMQSRPDKADPDAIFLLGAPITTDRLRFTATGGDNYYSVSEIRAFAVTEPSTLLMLSCAGLLAFASSRRRDATA